MNATKTFCPEGVLVWGRFILGRFDPTPGSVSRPPRPADADIVADNANAIRVRCRQEERIHTV